MNKRANKSNDRWEWTIAMSAKIKNVVTVTASSRSEAVAAAILIATSGRGRIVLLESFEPRVESKRRTRRR